MWICQQCSETNEDSFDVCWQCGTTEAGKEDLTFETVDNSQCEASELPAPMNLKCPFCGSPTVAGWVWIGGGGQDDRGYLRWAAGDQEPVPDPFFGKKEDVEILRGGYEFLIRREPVRRAYRCSSCQSVSVGPIHDADARSSSD